MTHSSPISLDEYTNFLKPFAKELQSSKSLAVMVSGGADSLALLWLTWQWVQQNEGYSCKAVSINHHLRPEATQELKFVSHLANSWGIDHTILDWRGIKPTLDIQAKARQARYHLIDQWSLQNNIQNILLGHHLHDQVETFITRLCHGSTYYGLSSMKSLRPQIHNVLIRPLLSVSKHRLKSTLIEQKINWIEDPSNANEQFERIRIRKFLQSILNQEQFIFRVQNLITKCQILRQLIDQKTVDFFNQPEIVNACGYIKIPLNELRSHPWIEIERIFNHSLRLIGGAKKFFRSQSLKNLWNSLKNSHCQKTYAGCIILSKKDAIWFFCEARTGKNKQYLLQEVSSLTNIPWDHRFYLTFEKDHLKLGKRKLLIKSLGLSGWCGLPRNIKQNLLEKAPLQALLTFPVIWEKNKIISLPNIADQEISYKIVFNPTTMTF